MSVADMINVASDFVADFTEVYSPITIHNLAVFCEAFVFVKATASKTSSWLIFSMSFERFVATYYPFRYKDHVTMKLLSRVSVACVVFATLSCLLGLMAYGNERGTCFEERIGANRLLVLIAVVDATLFHLIIPSISTAVLNVLIIIKMKRRTFNERLLSKTLPFSIVHQIWK